MFEQFSQGYYLGRLYVEPGGGDAATMCQEQHERVAGWMYGADGERIPTEVLLVMKLGTRHFPVHGERGVPADTLSVPSDIVADTDIRNPPTLSEVFLAKADRAAQLLRYDTVGHYQ